MMESKYISSLSTAVFRFVFALSVLSPVKGQCNSDGTTLTDSFGTFSSPNYPGSYPNDTTCRWIIIVPEGHRVKLTFQTFLLETCTIPSICTCDHVEVRDGNDGGSTKLGKYCGTKTPDPIYSTGRFMWIEFESDFRTTATGFRATYTSEEQQCKSSGISLIGSSGSITSPNYPRSYPNSETCRWTITVPEGHRVKLTFQTFLLETCTIPSICTCDHVEVRDGNDEGSTKLGKYCGTKTPDPIYSTGRFMWIEFESDFRTTATGFRATYTSEEIESQNDDGKGSHFVFSAGIIAGIVIGVIVAIIIVVGCCYLFCTMCV